VNKAFSVSPFGGKDGMAMQRVSAEVRRSGTLRGVNESLILDS
jgi:hypothetical protein